MIPILLLCPQAIISSLKLNVEFYFDSLPYTAMCVRQRWPLWVSSWDQGPPYDSSAYDDTGDNKRCVRSVCHAAGSIFTAHTGAHTQTIC